MNILIRTTKTSQYRQTLPSHNQMVAASSRAKGTLAGLASLVQANKINLVH